MDSINRNQLEDNREDLRGKDAVERIRDMVNKAETCFFCTAVSRGSSGATRPMAVQEVDDNGTLWFLSASDSHKNSELEANPAVRLFFQVSEHAGFLTLTGNARISRDRKKIKGLWNPVMKTWFTGGEDDPRITAIAVAPSGGYYWDNKHGKAIAGIKMLIGAATGKTLDDSIEGTLGVTAKRASA
jgi:general stress protein 26